MEDRKLVENYNDLREVVAAAKQNRAKKGRSMARKHVAQFSAYMEKRKGENDRQED